MLQNNYRKYTPIIKVYDPDAEGDINILGTKKTAIEQTKR